MIILCDGGLGGSGPLNFDIVSYERVKECLVSRGRDNAIITPFPSLPDTSGAITPL